MDPSIAGRLGELSLRLARSADVAACFARQWVRAGYGAGESDDVTCAVERAVDALSDGDLSFGEVLVALTQTAGFRGRRADRP